MNAEQRLGYSINIYIAGEKFSGLRLVEKSNWNGGGVVFPRASFAQVEGRPEFKKAGVYLLLGPSETSGEMPRAYIGEGDPVLPRLKDHHANREFWTSAVFFHGNLNKAHIQYLESRMVTLAKEAKRCSLENGNAPALPTLSEPEIASAEGFLEELMLCLPAIGVGIFDKPATTASETRRILFLKTKGIEARGYESEDGFVVLKDSNAFLAEDAFMADKTKATRKALRDQGILVEENGLLRLTQDYTFNSPSLACSVFAANNSSGRESWKDAHDTPLKQLQEAEAAAADAA